MKNFIFFLLFNLFLVKCENDPNDAEQIEQKVNYYIEELGYKNMKSITREEFRKLFLRLFENKDETSKEFKEDLDIIFGLTNSLFDYIVPEDKQKIEINQIYDYFEPNNIVSGLKKLLKKLGMEELVDTISETFFFKYWNCSNSFRYLHIINFFILEFKIIFYEI